jgi:hypothetical protein
MMNCLLRTIQAIAEQSRSYMDQSPSPVKADSVVLDADTLFPLVLWVVIHANLQHTGPHYLLAHLDRFAQSQHPGATLASDVDDEMSVGGTQHQQRPEYASYGPTSYARTLIEAAVRLVVTIEPSQLFLSEQSALEHQSASSAITNTPYLTHTDGMR